jgi:hypothetical protein
MSPTCSSAAADLDRRMRKLRQLRGELQEPAGQPVEVVRRILTTSISASSSYSLS